MQGSNAGHPHERQQSYHFTKSIRLHTKKLNTNILNDPDMKERLKMEIEMYPDHSDTLML